MIVYNLLNNRKGVLRTRTPEIYADNLLIKFIAAPTGATAVLKNAIGNELYVVLNEEGCVEIDKRFLVIGDLQVGVTLFDTSMPWKCEALSLSPNSVYQNKEGVLIMPSDTQTSERLASLEIANDDLQKRLKKAEEGFSELSSVVGKLTSGTSFFKNGGK